MSSTPVVLGGKEKGVNFRVVRVDATESLWVVFLEEREELDEEEIKNCSANRLDT